METKFTDPGTSEVSFSEVTFTLPEGWELVGVGEDTDDERKSQEAFRTYMNGLTQEVIDAFVERVLENTQGLARGG